MMMIECNWNEFLFWFWAFCPQPQLRIFRTAYPLELGDAKRIQFCFPLFCFESSTICEHWPPPPGILCCYTQVLHLKHCIMENSNRILCFLCKWWLIINELKSMYRDIIVIICIALPCIVLRCVLLNWVELGWIGLDWVGCVYAISYDTNVNMIFNVHNITKTILSICAVNAYKNGGEWEWQFKNLSTIILAFFLFFFRGIFPWFWWNFYRSICGKIQLVPEFKSASSCRAKIWILRQKIMMAVEFSKALGLGLTIQIRRNIFIIRISAQHFEFGIQSWTDTLSNHWELE